MIYPQGPWKGLVDVEFATLTYVDWFNQRRLHGEIIPGPRYTTPAEFEADYYSQNVPTKPAGTQTPESLLNPGRFIIAKVRQGLAALNQITESATDH